MLDCVAAVACVARGLEVTEDGKAAVREGGDDAAELMKGRGWTGEKCASLDRKCTKKFGKFMPTMA